MNILEINKRMKQRPPFQMIDRVLEITPNKFGRGIKNVSINEPYFTGHFPEFPIMPGVLLTESAAQLCSIVVSDNELSKDIVPVLLKIDSMKFIKPVIPGDKLIIEVYLIQNSSSLIKFDVKIFNEDVKISTGTLSFTFIDKEKIYSE